MRGDIAKKTVSMQAGCLLGREDALQGEAVNLLLQVFPFNRLIEAYGFDKGSKTNSR